ncbi:MAG TPA: transglycosylase domain-containing protein, partial [Candidatus Hydrogenedentes bacterium]|nr:transglycosylase domain-containing protein [Candidatus Hydrogenedentota bacterium]
ARQIRGYRSRTQLDKVREAWTALRIERTLDKRKILELYLNHAPFGGNSIGIEAAARRFFGRPARDLSLSEAALLAGMPQAPSRLNPLKNPQGALKRRNEILRRLLRAGAISKAACEEALDDPMVHLGRHDFPREAAHPAFYVRNAKSFSGIVQTTLDRDIQRITELVTRAHLARLNGLADQAAVIVMDVPSGEVLAWAGSRDFWADAPGAQVDHARSRRSPGSALKPFVYGLAMERGLLYPDELLLDGPVDYGSYRPGNFSGDFEGLVTTTEALRMSLNIPAVVVLKRIGSDAFRSWLVGSGIRDPNLMREIWGLGSPLGSVEVTLEELLTLYMGIARFGSAQSPVLLRCGESPPAQLLLRPDICAMFWRMMEQPLPGDLP